MSDDEGSYFARQFCAACDEFTDHRRYKGSTAPRCGVCWERFWKGYLSMTDLDRARLKFHRWRHKTGQLTEGRGVKSW